MFGRVKSHNTSVVVHTLGSYVQPEQRIVPQDGKDKAISDLVQCRICSTPQKTNELQTIPHSNKRCVYALDPVICRDCVSNKLSTQTCPLCHDIINDSDSDENSQTASLSIESPPETVTINIPNPNPVQRQQDTRNFVRICKIASIAGMALTFLVGGIVCLVTLVKKTKP